MAPWLIPHPLPPVELRGANTAIVVSSPLIGKTAGTGAQRFVATYIGERLRALALGGY